jgi:hypothetical protein
VKTHDIVYVLVNRMPVVGEIVGHTPKRLRIVVKIHGVYRYLIRAKNNVQFIQKGKRFL